MENLRNALSELQSKTIGIAKIHGQIEMVIEDDNYSFKTVSIGSLGGLSTSYYPKSDFSFKRFDLTIDNLANFLKTPHAFANWYNDNFK